MTSEPPPMSGLDSSISVSVCSGGNFHPFCSPTESSEPTNEDGTILSYEEDDERSTSTNDGGGDAFRGSRGVTTNLAFRAPWATPPRAPIEDTTSYKWDLLSPPYNVVSPSGSHIADSSHEQRKKWDNSSYVERLLLDGGDLDSMDRSLLEYNGPNHPGFGSSMNGSNTITPSGTPITSPTSYKSSENGPHGEIMLSPSDVTNQIMKRDLVVRFTEEKSASAISQVKSSIAQKKAPSIPSSLKVAVGHNEASLENGSNNASFDGDANSEADPGSAQGDVQDEDNLIRTQSGSTNLYLYQDDISERPQMASVIGALANYSATIQVGPSDPDAKPVEKANLGTLTGVFLPCIQNIFGVILFIRMTWIVGTAGAVGGFFVVFLGCCVTMLTAISMAAIATNGVVPGGGSYFMISRALGPEFGGAVGILFYLATTVAGAMYIIGAIEIAMTYLIGPPMSLFGPDITDDFIKFNNYRVYGTILLLLMGCVVFVGVSFVNKLATVALACVLLTIFSIYVGLAVNYGGNDLANVCVVGTRLVRKVDSCNKTFDGPLFHMFCEVNDTLGFVNDTSSLTIDDYICDEYFTKNDAKIVQGIQGLKSSAFAYNIPTKFHDAGDALSSDGENEPEYNLGGLPKMGYVTTDVYTTFTILVGIFFPSCTGIMAGSNRSGDLADPQKSIPIGTIMAILTTSTVYLSSVLLFAGTVDPLLLRDKFGESIGGSLVVGNIAWPHPKVVEVGSLLSTIGAGLQSLTGAPRLLQAIAQDGIIPFLAPFQTLTSSGEPIRALGVTITICEIAVLIGNVDEIAPLLSMFFLMCYGFVNLACALQTLLRTPNWRPRFKYYHWSLSLLGVCLCLAVMFMSSWYYALVAIGIAGIIYKYIEYRGAEKEWGDGLRGLALSAARFSLLRLEEGPPHTKNWRPQIVILAKMDYKLHVKYKRMFSLASQLKAGKGLCIGVTVVEGNYGKMYGEAQAAKVSIQQTIKDEAVKGFAEVVVSKHTSEGICHLIQTAGLGGMKPNTIILGWPNSWRKRNEDSWRVFVDTIRNAASAKMALLVPKGIQRFPDSGDKVKGNIDIWWIVHDGGLLMLLPFLLKQHRTWKNCKLRIFSIAQPQDNSIQMKKDLKTFLYHLRIEADVEVVEMADSDISDYTYERTLLMEQRNEMLKEMRVSEKRRGKMTRRLSLATQPKEQFKVVDDLIIQTDKKTNDLEVEKIVDRHVETVLENCRAEETESQERPASKVKFTEDKSDDEEEGAPAKGSKGAEEKEKTGNSLNPPGGKTRNDNSNVRRMHTAVRLNEAIVSKSHEAKLVILNLPSPPKTIGPDRDSSYMEFLEVLTEGLERVMMVRGGGREVITIYS